jgi:hypothetical protein
VSQNMSQSISVKESIERRLASEVRRDPSLLERLRTDPESIIRPMIAEALGDDGELDLSTISTAVHIEDPRTLHFVVTPPSASDDNDEVVGFALGGVSIAESLRVGSVDVGGMDRTLSAKRTTKGKRCGYGSTMTLEPECLKDPWGS